MNTTDPSPANSKKRPRDPGDSVESEQTAGSSKTAAGSTLRTLIKTVTLPANNKANVLALRINALATTAMFKAVRALEANVGIGQEMV
nr:hypothetical protein I308_01467 [Cryptococcus tetragattii IND107]